jgi:hypothetical protein
MSEIDKHNSIKLDKATFLKLGPDEIIAQPDGLPTPEFAAKVDALTNGLLPLDRTVRMVDEDGGATPEFAAHINAIIAIQRIIAPRRGG